MNVFDKALEIIHKVGFTKFELCDDQGRMCLYGALNTAAYNHYMWGDINGTDDPYSQHLNKVAVELFPDRLGYGAVLAVDVNNHHDTTQEDVELILKHAGYEWDLLHTEK